MSEVMRSLEQAIVSLPLSQWDNQEHHSSAVSELERGKVIYLPNLSFSLSPSEQTLLNPRWVDPKRKNISYQPQQDRLSGVAKAEKSFTIRQLLHRHHLACLQLVSQILPEYQSALHTPTNSLRLHPVSGWTDSASWRKDDRRLHVDAFPSRPNYGERILRIFTNVNPHQEPRNWRIGQPFPSLAEQFLPKVTRYSPMLSWLQNSLGITKRRRSHYDHLMLKIHDAMKSDSQYQRQGQQLAMDFPAGSSWICFSDQTPHAAMGGQFMLEQTFLLPVEKMLMPQRSPLKVLETMLNKPLI